MPSFHHDQARRNYRVSRLLRDSGYVEWAMTALFYTALHCVDHWLAHVARPPTNHAQRRNYLARLAVPPDIREAYRRLYELSVTARYTQWSGHLNRQFLDEVHEREHKIVCRHFDAPEEITP